MQLSWFDYGAFQQQKGWRRAMKNDTAGFRPTRRWVGKALAAGAACAALPVSLSAHALGGPRCFSIDTAGGSFVRMSAGDVFTVSVIGSDGSEIERHESVTAASVFGLRSSYFSVREIPVPA